MLNQDFNVSEYMANPSAAYGDVLQLRMRAEQHRLELDKVVNTSIQNQVNHLMQNYLTTMSSLRPVQDGTYVQPKLATKPNIIRDVVIHDITNNPLNTPKGIQKGKLIVFYVNGFANDVFYVDTNVPLVVECNAWFCTSEYVDMAGNIKSTIKKKLKKKKAKK